MLPASSEPALELTIHSHFTLSSWQATQAVWQQLLPPRFIQGIPGGLPLANQQTDCKWTDLSCYTSHIPTFHKKYNLHDCPHLFRSGCLQLTLGCLTMKSCFLCCHTSGLLDTSVFCQLLLLHPHSPACQCLIPLLHPLLFLLLKLIGIQIVVFLRAIGDQELCYGFMLEIVGHDGIQEFALRRHWSIYQEVQRSLAKGLVGP